MFCLQFYATFALYNIPELVLSKIYAKLLKKAHAAGWVLFTWRSLVPWYPTHWVPLGTWVVQFENSRYHGEIPRLWVRRELGAGSGVGSEYLWDHEQATRTSELGVSHVTWGLGSEQFSHTRLLKLLRALDGWGKAGNRAITSVTYWHFGLSGKIYIGQLNWISLISNI